eukprot:1037800-Pleurochrysis_carterae.AAC.1
MACLRVRRFVDAAQAAKAQPVFRPHCSLSRRERSANSAAPRDLNGYGPKVRLKARGVTTEDTVGAADVVVGGVADVVVVGGAVSGL